MNMSSRERARARILPNSFQIQPYPAWPSVTKKTDGFHISVQQNRTDVEANFEAVCIPPGLKSEVLSNELSKAN